MDSVTTGMSIAFAVDGLIGLRNDSYTNMDTTHELTAFNYVKSYYVTVRPRTNAVVMDQGAYTFTFQLADANSVVRATKSVTIDFVSTAAKSDAVVALATSGTFLAATAVASYDSTSATWAKATLTNRSGGLVRTNTGGQPDVPVKLQSATTAAPTYVDSSAVITVTDDGTYGTDHGTNSLTSPGNGTNRAYDGVYGVKFTTGAAATSATTGQAYQLWAGYGNATIVTAALTVYAQSGSGTASAANTDVLVTAAGMSLADQAVKTTATSAFTLPTTTKTATIKYTIQTSSDTNTPGALITVKPTWGSTVGTAQVTPATSASVV